MLPYPVWQLGLLLTTLRDLEWTTKQLMRNIDVLIPREVLEILPQRMSYTRRHCAELELPVSVERVNIISERLKNGLTHRQLGDELKYLNETISSELKYRRFAYVPTDKAKLLDNFLRDWEAVLREFTSATDEIRAAVECYALDCNTACVFHSMRVAERGLRILAKALKVKTLGPQKHPLEFAEWGQILSALAGKLKAIQQTPGRNAKKAALAKFYADAASQADYLNEIWRKEVSHARGMYNAPEALNALTRTHDFMNLLSQRLSEKRVKA